MKALIKRPVKHVEEFNRSETLSPLDGGYYDTLAAIGLAALTDAYFAGPSPEIERTEGAYQVSWNETEISKSIDLGWLRYSIAASWHAKDAELLRERTKMDDFKIGAGKEAIHQGAVVDTKEDPRVIVENGDWRSLRVAPNRLLYGAINKLGNPTWVNACIHIAREHGIELIAGKLDPKVSFNSIVHPGGSKGGNSAKSFSIANGSLGAKVSQGVWRQTILATVGLIFAARGSGSDGFVVPFPEKTTVSRLRDLVNTVRLKALSIGPIMPYQAYCHYLRLLTTMAGEKDMECSPLFAVGGASFIELGTAASPAGNWILRIPKHRYTVHEIDRLENFLRYWRKSVTANNNTSISRADLGNLMGGFAEGDGMKLLRGYVRALAAIPLNKNLYYQILPKSLIVAAIKQNNTMKNKQMTYDDLIRAVESGPLRSLIEAIRSRTVSRARQEDKNVDYTLIQRLRDPQSSKDLVETIARMATEARIDLMSKQKASENRKSEEEKQTASFVKLPTDASVLEAMRLMDKYGYRTVGTLLVGLAMSQPNLDK